LIIKYFLRVDYQLIQAHILLRRFIVHIFTRIYDYKIIDTIIMIMTFLNFDNSLYLRSKTDSFSFHYILLTYIYHSRNYLLQMANYQINLLYFHQALRVLYFNQQVKSLFMTLYHHYLFLNCRRNFSLSNSYCVSLYLQGLSHFFKPFIVNIHLLNYVYHVFLFIPLKLKNFINIDCQAQLVYLFIV
jgi:hypothetical protein